MSVQLVPIASEELPAASRDTGPQLPAVRSSVATIVVAALLSIAALWLAQAILVPIVMGVLISYALYPVQRRITGWGLPSSVAAALILWLLLAGCGAAAYGLRNQASAFVAEVPRLAQQLKKTVRTYRRAGPSTVEQFERAANELKEAATTPLNSAVPKGITRVQIETPVLRLSDVVWRGWLGGLEFTGQALLVVFLAYYLLAAGDLYKRKIIKIVGPSLSHKRATVEILDQIDHQIESFLVTRALVSLVVAVATGLAFLALGVGQAAIWGVAAGILNIVPYVGPAAVTLAAGLAAYLQFGTLPMALTVAGAATAVASVEGFVITPWLMGRAGRMSAAAIFVGVSFWGWLWGISGMLLAVPILMAMKAVCDHVDGLQFIGELLAD